jgi:protein-glutamine gamma-glutamyltransferase
VRFAFAHKLTTYLAVLSAYFALTLSGELGRVHVGLALAGIIASWSWEPPRVRYERWATAWTILSAGVFALSVLSFVTGGDVLIVGAHFLLYLAVAKLFSRRTSRDYLQIYVLSFLMLVAGTVLNAGFSYGLFFFGYVLTSTWAFVLFHLRREMEDNFLLKHSKSSTEPVQVTRILNSKRIVGGRFFAGTALISMAVFLCAGLLFLAIPRIGLGLFFPKRRAGVHLTGFDDAVRLGGHGQIKDDPTVVMRVYVDARFQGRAAPGLHWRGVAFDHYQNGQWTRSRRAPRTEVTLDSDVDRQLTWVHLRYDRVRELPLAELNRRITRGMRQKIYLEPMGTDVLFGASMPQTFEFQGLDPKERATSNDELRKQHGAGIRYVVYSDPEPPSAAVLRATSPTLPDPDPVASRRGAPARSYEVYLQLPEEVTARVRELAHEVVAGKSSWYDQARAIEAYLRREYAYTLEMVAPPRGQEPVDFFLFDRRRGHCEYFSSAMAIMLRAVGVPARNVNGFYGGAWNEYDRYIAVRGGDAHSWVEVYFPGHGWVTFDPTPPGGRDQLGRGGTGVLDKLQRMMDTLRLRWFQWVIEYDLQRQVSMFRSLQRNMGSSRSSHIALRGVRDWTARNRGTIGLIICALVVLAVLASRWLRRRDPRRALAIARELSAGQNAIAGLYLAAQTRYARHGLRRPRSATAREFASSLQRAAAPGADSFARLTELYYRAVYGGHDGDDTRQQAQDLSEAIARAWRQSRRRAAAPAGPRPPTAAA